MASINKVLLIGYIGADPEVRYINNTPLCNFSLATINKWTENNQTKKKTTWHRIAVWGTFAKTCEQYLKKGSQVFIEGRLEIRTWTAEDGNKRSMPEIVASKIEFISNTKGSQGNNNQTSQNSFNEEFDKAYNDVFGEPIYNFKEI